jgi:hypothetical protein
MSQRAIAAHHSETWVDLGQVLDVSSTAISFVANDIQFFLDGIIMYDVVPGSVNSARFVQFLRELLIIMSIPSISNV